MSEKINVAFLNRTWDTRFAQVLLSILDTDSSLKVFFWNNLKILPLDTTAVVVIEPWEADITEVPREVLLIVVTEDSYGMEHYTSLAMKHRQGSDSTVIYAEDKEKLARHLNQALFGE